MSEFFEDVYKVVRTIPKGKVTTYGKIAKVLLKPRSSRAVGYALHANPYFGEVPCHRVVNREGRLAPAFVFGGIDVQREMLEKEGVTVREDYTVNLEEYLYDPLI